MLSSTRVAVMVVSFCSNRNLKMSPHHRYAQLDSEPREAEANGTGEGMGQWSTH